LLGRRSDAVVAKNNLAFVLADTESPSKQELDRALSLARDARQRLPGNPEVADTLGWVLCKRKEYAEAAKLLEESVAAKSAGPDRATTLYHLAVAQEGLGDKSAAKASAERALSEAKDFPSRDATAKLLERVK
jgi:Tfp pilus assembly protein PilF